MGIHLDPEFYRDTWFERFLMAFRKGIFSSFHAFTFLNKCIMLLNVTSSHELLFRWISQDGYNMKMLINNMTVLNQVAQMCLLALPFAKLYILQVTDNLSFFRKIKFIDVHCLNT